MEIAGYTIERCIAEGGMAAAYLAKQLSLDRTVVLKVLDTSINESRLARRRFMNEGQLLAALRHPNIITIYDIGTASNFVYLSMEYVAGGDLKQRIAAGPLAPDDALDILEKVAHGLAAAHAAGIVHRDVKPGNILFRADGTPLLSDFGIAKSLLQDADLTATGVFLGSPNYMAPEQAEPGEVDFRVDIYALGVILYEMLTGEKPYQSDSVIDVIHMHKKAPIPRLPAGQEGYQELLELMLAKDRKRRFRDVPAMLHYLETLRAPPASTPTATTATVTRVRWESPPRRRWLLYGLLAAALAGYLALFIVEAKLNAPPRFVDPGERSQLTATRVEIANVPAVAGLDPDNVLAALLWLGNHHLNLQRLTTPPTENAYYYYSRALQLAPDNLDAQNGIREIAKRYAMLADEALVQGEAGRAAAYLAIGREIDPHNEALNVIGELSRPRADVWRTLRQWWARLW